MGTTTGALRVVALLGPDPDATAAVADALVRETGVTPPAVAEAALAALAVEADGIGLRLLTASGTPCPEVASAAALRAADAVLLVLPAVGGPDARTVQQWDDAGARGLPRVVAVTGLDVPLADFDEAVALGQRLLGDAVLPLQLPMHGDDDAVAGLIDLLDLRVHDWSRGTPVDRPPDPEHVRNVEGLRGDLVESVLAESDNDTLLDRYLDGEVLGERVLHEAFAVAVRTGRLHPVVAVQHPVGTTQLRALLAVLPGSDDAEPPAVTRPDGTPVAPLTVDPDGPLAAEVLGRAADGWLVRVWSGTLRTGAQVRAVGHGRPERDGVVGAVTGPAVDGCPAGELCTVELSAGATTDTLSAPHDPLLLARWDLPEPLHPVALRTSDAAGLAAALADLELADPVLRLDPDADPAVVWVLDDRHATVVVEQLRHAGVDVEALDADLGDGADVDLLLEVPTASLRPVLRTLARHGAGGVESHEDDERDVALVRASVPRGGVAGLAPALAAASQGTARRRRA